MYFTGDLWSRVWFNQQGLSSDNLQDNSTGPHNTYNNNNTNTAPADASDSSKGKGSGLDNTRATAASNNNTKEDVTSESTDPDPSGNNSEKSSTSNCTKPPPSIPCNTVTMVAPALEYISLNGSGQDDANFKSQNWFSSQKASHVNGINTINTKLKQSLNCHDVTNTSKNSSDAQQPHVPVSNVNSSHSSSKIIETGVSTPSTKNHNLNTTNSDTNATSPFCLTNRFKRKRDNRASTFALQHNAKPLIGEYGGCPWKSHRKRYDIGIVG